MSTPVATVRVHPDKYEKDFDVLVAFFTQYIDNRALTLSVKVASDSQKRPAKWQKTSTTQCIFKEKDQLKKFSREECNSMSMTQHRCLYELQSSRALEARVAILEAKIDNSSNESLFADEKPKADDRNNPAIDKMGIRIRQSHVTLDCQSH